MAGFLEDGEVGSASRLNNLAIQYGTFANRPSPDLENMSYISTDTNVWYQVRSSAWVDILSGSSIVDIIEALTGDDRIAHTSVKGLGSAAELDVGNDPNEVVQLNSSAKIPNDNISNTGIRDLLQGLSGNSRIVTSALRRIEVADEDAFDALLNPSTDVDYFWEE